MDPMSSLAYAPIQTYIALTLQVWLFVIFPLLVIRKLNNLTTLLEAYLPTQEEES